jgi:hypothetical protein
MKAFKEETNEDMIEKKNFHPYVKTTHGKRFYTEANEKGNPKNMT